jgi:predicted Rossmann fold flavoprotein
MNLSDSIPVNQPDIYDIAVIGAGPAGLMAAIRAGELKKRVLLIEKNDSIGRKLLLTGKGRCNITNTAPIETFIEKFGKQGEFFRTAFFSFFNQDLMDFFQSKGLELKAERQNRVFPITDSAQSVIDVLKKCLKENNIEVSYNTKLKSLIKDENGFRLEIASKDANLVIAKKVILSTGGASYKITGSSGDGFRIAQELGHTITPLKPALVPLRTKEYWILELQGLTLKNVTLTFVYGKKKIVSTVGDLMCTHFGVSGPLVLDLSGEIVTLLDSHKEISLFIDLKTGLTIEQLDKRLLREFKENGTMIFKNIMKSLLPETLIPVFIRLSNIKPEIKGSEITREQRNTIIKLLKGFPLTVTGSLPIDQGMVTNGGVSIKEINPRTMESKIVPGLYFAGEIIDGYASSGGYNLQQAFSTGYLAGENAAGN